MSAPTTLAFQSHGSPLSPTLVFLHGGGAGGWMWRPAIQHLSDYYCIAPDQPETGGSRHIAPFSIELAAQKVAELIRDQAPGGRACVIGLSEGAQIAVQLLAAAPECVEKAVISSALLRAVPGTGWASSPGILAWAYKLSVGPFRGSEAWIRLNMKYSAGIPDAYFAEFKQGFQALTETEFVNLMVANQSFRLPSGLGQVEAPTLALAGKKEFAAMRQSVRDLVAALPCAKGGWINLGKGASLAQEHNWALTAPELFALTVRAWVEGKPLPTEIEPF